MKLRDYQQKIVDDTRQVISLGKKKVLVVSATGSGKSVIISEIFRLANEKGKKCLFLVHRRNLVTQIKATMELFGLTVGVIMSGVESDLSCDVQVSTIQTFARRLQLESLDRNRFFFPADIIAVDECLHGDTVVSGKKIKDILPGDFVDSYNEVTGSIEKKIVKRKFINRNKGMLTVKFSNGATVNCTAEHRFYVSGKGYLPAKELCVNMSATYYVNKRNILTTGGKSENILSVLFNLFDGDRGESGEQKPQIHLQKMYGGQERGKIQSGHGWVQELRIACGVQTRRAVSAITCRCKKWGSLLLSGLCGRTSKEGKEKEWGVSSRLQQRILLGSNGKKQPDVETGNCRKDENYEKKKWILQHLPCFPWWEWQTNFCSAGEIGGNTGMGNRGCGEDKGAKGNHRFNAKPLQNRYSQQREKDSHRGGWPFTQREEKAKGQEKRGVFEDVRVESVEVYKPGDNGKFESVRGPSFVYDLEVEGNHNYFANGILVHNCHRVVSKQYKDVLDLYDGKVIIGFTGTPARSDGRGLGEVFDVIVDAIGVKELTKQGYLAEVTYYCPPVGFNLDKVKTQCGDYQIAELGDKMSKPKLVGDVVDNWLKYGQNRKTIVFAVNVKHSKHLYAAFEAKGIPSARLDAKSREDERNAVFEAMENGDIVVLINVLLYVEGMDCPEIGCVSFARPTKSLVLYRQGAGRGMRPKKNGGDLIFLDHGGVVERHGFIDDEIEWSLDGKELAWKKPDKAKKEKRPLKCAVCHKIFDSGAKCPDCGSELQNYGKDVATLEAELEQKKPKKATLAEKRRWYGMALSYVKSKGWNEGAAAHKYKEYFKVWPRGMDGVLPIVPDASFLNYMRHLAIKWAKSKPKPAEKQQWI